MKKPIQILLIILAILLVFSPTPAYADFFIPFFPTSMFTLLRTLVFNFIVNLVAIYLVSCFYLHFKNIVKVFISSILVTIIGGVVDIVSVILAAFLLSLFMIPFKENPLNGVISGIAFLVFFSLICFVLLWLMYKFMVKKIFGTKIQRKIVVSSVILALVTHPLVFILLVYSPLFIFNQKLAEAVYKFFYGYPKQY